MFTGNLPGIFEWHYMHVQNFDHLAKQKKEITVEPLVRDKNYIQRLDGHLWEVVAYESRTARAKFLSQQKKVVYLFKKNYESLLSPANLIVVLLTKSLAILCDSS